MVLVLAYLQQFTFAMGSFILCHSMAVKPRHMEHCNILNINLACMKRR